MSDFFGGNGFFGEKKFFEGKKGGYFLNYAWWRRLIGMNFIRRSEPDRLRPMLTFFLPEMKFDRITDRS